MSGSTTAPPRQLPAAIGAFVGRTQHLDELTTSIDRPVDQRARSVILAIVGAAVVGKTNPGI
jgi:hypothetical protein